MTSILLYNIHHVCHAVIVIFPLLSHHKIHHHEQMWNFSLGSVTISLQILNLPLWPESFNVTINIPNIQIQTIWSKAEQ